MDRLFGAHWFCRPADFRFFSLLPRDAGSLKLGRAGVAQVLCTKAGSRSRNEAVGAWSGLVADRARQLSDLLNRGAPLRLPLSSNPWPQV